MYIIVVTLPSPHRWHTVIVTVVHYAIL